MLKEKVLASTRFTVYASVAKHNTLQTVLKRTCFMTVIDGEFCLTGDTF